MRTDRQKERLETEFADERHIDVEVTERIYRTWSLPMPAPTSGSGNSPHSKSSHASKPVSRRNSRSCRSSAAASGKRRKEILAYFDIDASNGPVEAINGRLEHLRGIALGFRNLKHYILRSLIHFGQLRERINAL